MQVIEALLVTLGLDASKFKQGNKEASDGMKKLREEGQRTAKDLEASTKVLLEGYRAVQLQLLSVATAFVGAFAGGSVMRQVGEMDRSTGKMAQNLGMATDELSAWQGVAARAGGTASGVTSTISGLSNAIATLQNTGNNPALLSFLARAHVDSKFMNSATTWTERLLMVADALKTLAPANRRYLASTIGIDDDTLTVLMKGREALSAMLAEQRKLALTTGDTSAAALAEEAAWEKLDQKFQQAARTMKTEMLPVLLKVVDVLGAIVDRVVQAIEVLRPLGSVIQKAYHLYHDGTQMGRFVDWYVGNEEADAKPKSAPQPAPAARAQVTTGGPTKSALLAMLERRYGLPEGVLHAVWAQESGRGKNKGPSRAGAVGDFQFMPATWKAYGEPGMEMDFTASANAAAKLLADLLKRYGSLQRALAAYNAGDVRAQSGMWPAETVEYIRQVQSRMHGAAASTTRIDIDRIADQIIVNTQATDAAGIARDLGQALKNHVLAAQGNSVVK